MPTYHKKYTTVSRWFSRIDARWGLKSVRELERWCEWLRSRGEEANPDKIVAFQVNAIGNDRFKYLDLLQEYVNGLNVRIGSKSMYYGTIRGFFMHNRADLPRDKSFKIMGEGKISGTLTIEDIKAVITRSNPCYRAAFTCMFMGGMGSGELVEWSNNGYTSLIEQLSKKERPIKIELGGRKQGKGRRPFYTLIGKDAEKNLKEYLNVRPEGKTIFMNIFGNPINEQNLQQYWRAQLKALRLRGKGERKGNNLHEMRDVFRSRWEMSRTPGTAAEFIMGHIIDKNDYNKAYSNLAFTRSMYRQAESWLNILSESPDQASKEEVQTVRREMEAFRQWVLLEREAEKRR